MILSGATGSLPMAIDDFEATRATRPARDTAGSPADREGAVRFGHGIGAESTSVQRCEGLPVIKFYFHPSPNPAKVALYLEEAEIPYEVVPIDTRRGEQHDPAFLAINPNAKTPAMTDGDATLFDSTAILLYLAGQCGKFLPPDTPAERARMLSWMMFIATGIGPYTGQYVHFRHFAPAPKEYAVNRYDFEAWRHWGILDARLATHRYLLGEHYTLVDMAAWGWARVIPFALGPEAWERLPNVKRLLDEINARPAAQRAEALKTRFSFKTEMDDEARRQMFPGNTRLAA